MRLGRKQAWYLDHMARMDNGGPMTVCHAAQLRVLRSLERRGLVEDVGSGGTHGRSECRRYRVTDAGRAAIAEAEGGERV